MSIENLFDGIKFESYMMDDLSFSAYSSIVAANQELSQDKYQSKVEPKQDIKQMLLKEIKQHPQSQKQINQQINTEQSKDVTKTKPKRGRPPLLHVWIIENIIELEKKFDNFKQPSGDPYIKFDEYC